MTIPTGYRLRDARPDDLPAIAALRESVGWAAHPWALEVVLRPPARCVVLTTTDDEHDPVAVGSGIAYGALGFVGNMVVAEAHRRRRLGSIVLEAVTGFLEESGCTRLELYATSDGRPLYARHGFEPADPSAMGRIPRAAALGEAGHAVREVGREALPLLAAYDAPRFGGDRAPLLEMMLGDRERPVLVAGDGEILGYAWLRADGDRLGPFLADDPAVAASLVAAAFDRCPDAEAMTLNLPTANRGGVDWLRGAGAELETWDGRMGRGTPIPRRDETIYGNVVGALG